MSKFILNPEEIAPLREMIAGIAAAYDFAEDPEFLMEAAVAAHEMPRRLRSALIRFKLDEPDSAVLIVSGFPVDDGKVGATPEHWERQSRRRPPTLEEEIFFVLASSLLGDCIGWSSQQGGYIIHDVMPIKGNENEQIGTGSEQAIWWHTEDAFHPMRGDYLGMMCLRNHDRVPTTFASLEQIRLDPEDWKLLFEPHFTILPDYSHGKDGVEEETDPGETGGAYLRIGQMRRKPEKIAVLHGSPESPYIRIDPYFMDPVTDNPSAQRALDALIRAVDGEIRDIVLEPGDICFIDNFKSVHGRRAFKARYDGRDRWLKRINIARDLRKSRAERPSARSRVIF
jgi:Fe(II)/alpha-ketoglutarate-dependent arginine beta-hydroxylase